MTTTTINDISDLSRILQENPEWAEHFRALLLSREVLTQPEKMAQLTERVDGLTARMDQFILEMREYTRRADARMEQFIQETREHARRTDARMDHFDQFSRETQEFIREMREFRAEQREINARAEARMDALTAELREFIAEQRQWNEEQRQWNERQQQWNEEQRQTNAAIFARLDRIEADIKDMKGDLSQLMGRQAERDTHRNIVNLLQENHPRLRRIVILKSDLIPFATELNDRIDDAEDEGLITVEERKALRAVDLVVRAIDRDTRKTIYFAVEVSRTVNNHDVTRAADRAEILGRIVQEQGIGAVVGGAVIPQAVHRAEERGVSVITSNRLVG